MSLLVPAGCEEDLAGILKRVHQGESIRRHEMKMMRKDGAVLDVLITILPALLQSQGISLVRRWNSTSVSMKTSTEPLLKT